MTALGFKPKTTYRGDRILRVVIGALIVLGAALISIGVAAGYVIAGGFR